MRVIADIPHEACKITVFAWNSRYIIKLEKGLLEQTFKIDEFELNGIDDIKKLLDDEFMQQALERFVVMRSNLQAALERI
jgi:fructose-bisphosphate aldolase class 1